MRSATQIKIRKVEDGSQITFAGRPAWALKRLLHAGERGLTTIDHPAPRWSHYIYLLRRAGLVITTDYETHKGDFPGNHGRYRLETPVAVVEGPAS
jgi:hypothetical protein